MPAITVPDFTVLPRIPLPAPADRTRQVRRITTAPTGFEGEGFPVKRAFAGADLADLDPFIHMDEMGEVEYAAGEARGTSWHPHRGFETVTYIMDGTFEHQDSEGGGGLITNGDTQWMTAGSGLLHIERPPAELVMSGGVFHGIQLWVNLPRAQKWHDPRYQDVRAAQQTLLTNDDGSALVRLIAGEIDGHGGPSATLTPITLAHATLTPGSRLAMGWPSGFNALAYVMGGRGTAGPQQRPVQAGQLVVFDAGDAIELAADTAQSGQQPELEVLLLGGRPINEPLAWAGPFVMNSEAEVRQAFEDFRAGRLGRIPAERV